MRTIALVNQKGGSGKTTTAVNLGAALGRKQRVLVVDLDPQGQSSLTLGGRDDADQSLLDTFVKDAPLAIRPSNMPGVDIVRSSQWLWQAEPALATEPARDTILRRALKQVRGYDFVLVDCPPTLGVLVGNALTACAEVIIPIEASKYGADGVPKLLATMMKIRQGGLNPKLKITAALATRVDDRRNADEQVVGEIRAAFKGRPILVEVIHESAAMKDACLADQPVALFAPRARAVDEYQALATKVARRAP